MHSSHLVCGITGHVSFQCRFSLLILNKGHFFLFHTILKTLKNFITLTHNRVILQLKCALESWNLEMLGFKERGKPEYPEKNLSEQE